MGKFIDKVALMSLLAGALYLFFMSAFRSIPLAAASAFFAMALFRVVSRRLPKDGIHKKRRARKDAANTLEEWSFLSPDEARENVSKLLLVAFPGQMDGASLTLISRHPSGGHVSVDDVTGEWKRRRGGARAVIVSFSKADDRAYQLARALQSPRVRLIDGTQLTGLIARYPPQQKSPPRAVRKTQRFKTVLRAAGRAKAGRCLASGGLMCIVYFITGMSTYLIAGTLLLLIAGVSLRGRKAPTTLFAE